MYFIEATRNLVCCQSEIPGIAGMTVSFRIDRWSDLSKTLALVMLMV